MGKTAPVVFPWVILLLLWAAVIVVVLGACRAAAAGDARERVRDAHWGTLAQ
jgi:hypothetical protein